VPTATATCIQEKYRMLCLPVSGLILSALLQTVHSSPAFIKRAVHLRKNLSIFNNQRHAARYVPTTSELGLSASCHDLVCATTTAFQTLIAPSLLTLPSEQWSAVSPLPPSMLESTRAMSATFFAISEQITSPPESAGISYSRASYYSVLGLYLLSFPGLWSTVKRSTKAKMKRKEFVVPGVNVAATSAASSSAQAVGQTLRQTAGEIMAYMKANNYEVVDAGETITFRGLVPRSLSQAFFLTFCTALGLLSLALVLKIQFQNVALPLIGEPNWFLLALLSPYAGLYYWRSGDRVDECFVKLYTNESETENNIIVQGSEEELERMWRTLGWQEKGMIKVDGLLDQLGFTPTIGNTVSSPSASDVNLP
jgi:hypothetical protein